MEHMIPLVIPRPQSVEFFGDRNVCSLTFEAKVSYRKFCDNDALKSIAPSFGQPLVEVKCFEATGCQINTPSVSIRVGSRRTNSVVRQSGR